MPIEINWEDAPEDATHHLHIQGGSWWARRHEEDGDMYDHWPIHGDKWHKVYRNVHGFKRLEDNYADGIVKRPPKEAPLPNGLQWIEGATHYNPNYGGFFCDLDNARIIFCNNGGWREFNRVALEYWAVEQRTIARFPEGQAAKVVAKPPMEKKPQPKRQVGWWT